MAQNLSVGIFSVEKKEFIEYCNINFIKIFYTLIQQPQSKTKFPLLASIDEYIDSYFSEVTRKSLIQELVSLKDLLPLLADKISEVTRFVERAEKNQLIGFIGD